MNAIKSESKHGIQDTYCAIATYMIKDAVNTKALAFIVQFSNN